MSLPRILATSELSPAVAKWITLRQIKYLDPAGTERLWETAERKTRKASGIDAVAVLTLLRSKTNAFPVSTVLVEQFRPPIGKVVVELPAGLIDEGETAEQAAIRELEEETGYKATNTTDSSPVIVSDPGMTNANMKLVTLDVELPDKLETPSQKLDAGEFIVPRVVALKDLKKALEEYDKQGFAVDARVSHFAAGYDLARRII